MHVCSSGTKGALLTSGRNPANETILKRDTDEPRPALHVSITTFCFSNAVRARAIKNVSDTRWKEHL